MTKPLEIYKCMVCGNIVEVLHEAEADLVCCGEKMKLQEEKSDDATTEKHVPYIEKVDGGYRVRVGENTEHPMTEDHYIEWIEVIAGNKIYRQHLNPGDKPEAIFKVEAAKVIAREYCNIHGHWKNQT